MFLRWSSLKLFTEFDFIKNSGYDVNQMEYSEKSLKIFPETASQILKEFQRCSFGDPFQKKGPRDFDLSRNIALVAVGYLHYRDMEQF